jgi:hypothetical protein
VLELAESPLRLFFYFMPPRLWRRIAKESNRYYDQQLNARVDRMLSAQHARGEESSREEVMLRETKSQKKIQPEDIVHCIGLLVARMLCPHKRKFADHWAKTGVGAVPKGTFGQFVRKARFDRIMQSLHFTNNTDPRAETDRAWKVRSVVETLQETFRRGYKTPPARPQCVITIVGWAGWTSTTNCAYSAIRCSCLCASANTTRPFSWGWSIWRWSMPSSSTARRSSREVKIRPTMRNFWKFYRLSYCRRLPLTSTKRYIQPVWMATCSMYYLWDLRLFARSDLFTGTYDANTHHDGNCWFAQAV